MDAGATCYGMNGTTGVKGLLRVCPRTFGNELPMDEAIDTGACIGGQPLEDPGTHVTTACMFVNKSYQLTTDVVAVGTLPLVILATTDIVIDNHAIDVSSSTTKIGAGGDPSTCVGQGAGRSGGAGSMGGSGGGGGGGTNETTTQSNGIRGGAGGANTGTGGGVGGGGQPIANFLELHGGCGGGAGGLGTVAGGAGGAGGGAVYLIAGNSITITSTGAIKANGAPGMGAPASANGAGGGGGGGAGGMIGLDAPMLVIEGTLQVEGGGGGGGGGITTAGHTGTGFGGGMGGDANAGPGGQGQTDLGAASVGGDGNTGGGGGGGGGRGHVCEFSQNVNAC